MKTSTYLSFLLLFLLTGICFAGDMRRSDFLKRHCQQLEQHQSEDARETQVAHMLSRLLGRIIENGDIKNLEIGEWDK
jgi:hypothetical protein